VKFLAVLAAVVVAATAVVVPVTLRLLRDDDAVAADLEDDLRGRSDAPLTVTRTANGSAVQSVGTRAGSPIRVGGTDPAGTFLDRYGRLLGADRADLVPIGDEPLLGGGTATRYQQTIDDVPVLGGELSVQVDADGGVLSSLADLSRGGSGVDTTPTVRPVAARRAAVAATARAVDADPSTLSASGPEPWIYDPSVIGPPSPLAPRLTWRVEVTSTTDPVRQLVLVDAEEGTIALSFSELALGLERRVCDAANTRQAQPCTAPYARVEGQPRLNPSTNPATANEVDLAYDYSGATYNFFASRFDRDGIADDGAPILSKVRFCKTDLTTPCPYDNAFWSGQQATFGQGFARADDVVAHELTHGVIEDTANLFFWYQSGAINESMADVFGEFVDQTDAMGDDSAGVKWQVGEDLAGPSLRSMSNPGAFGDPDRMTSGAYTADAAETDSGGVHTNSGVGNRTAVLITSGGTISGHPAVTGIGLEKAAAVYYEALTTLLTSGSDYADLGVALPQACANLVAGGVAGLTNAHCIQVQAAVVATELATDPPNASAPEAPVCAAGDAPSDLFTDDLEDEESGQWGYETINLDPGGFFRWSYQSEVDVDFATSGANGLYGPDLGAASDRRVHMTQSVPLPVGSTPFLRFRHAYGFERTAGVNRDGGVVEYSTNNGTTWTNLGPLFAGAAANGYNGALVGGGDNPLAGQSAFVGSSRGYVSSRANLLALAGQSVRFRFRLGEDEEGGTNYGWSIDDVRLYTCSPEPADPSVEVTLAADETMVTVGDVIHLHTTVHNDGNVLITGAEVTVAGCTEPLADLAVGATVIVDCEYTTVDPDDLGTWSATATVSADQFPSAQSSNTVDVAVLEPGTPQLTFTQTADEDSIGLGQPVTLHLTVRNTGNVDLTGAAISAPDAPECEEQAVIATIPVGGHDTIDCAHTPDALGTWTSTASVTTAQVPGPVEADPVEVEVLDLTAPAITIASPAHGAVFGVGQVVLADFTCTDDQPGPVDCDGPVDDGEAIDTTTPGAHTFTVTASDGADNDATVTHIYTVAGRRPDGRIRLGANGATVGDGVYNLTGVGQTRTAEAARGATATFFVTIQNDGAQPEAFRLRGQPSTTNYAIRYFTAGVDITLPANNGTYQTPVVTPGATRTVKVVVTVGSRAPAGSEVTRLVTISSASDPLVKDVVRFIVRRR
jgi:bacillolysin